jgi:hypothetical protein
MLAMQLHTYIFIFKVFALVDECLPDFYRIFVFKILHNIMLDILTFEHTANKNID